jgi:carbonic anhydrase
MQDLILGVHSFLSHYYAEKAELFRRISEGQSPPYLFITCSNSRIDPTLITDTDPGALFVVRNAGNIVPPHSAGVTGEAATIEYAVVVLKVQHIIVCGHSHCGAMTAILHPEQLAQPPTAANFLMHAEKVRRLVRSKYPGLAGDDQALAAVKENVLVQLENLRTLPAVAAAIAARQVELHGWVYSIETGAVLAYDPASKQFLPLGSAGGVEA